MTAPGRSSRQESGRPTETSLLERLRRRGWRLTPQRSAIAEVLNGEHVHMTAEEVLIAARERFPGVSVATVYNTLNEIVGLGEVLEVCPDEGRKRYDPNATRRHQHLVCVDCGEILDVHVARLPVLPDGERHGFEILDVEVVFRGRCERCSETAPEPE